jgi:hypothetical protein
MKTLVVSGVVGLGFLLCYQQQRRKQRAIRVRWKRTWRGVALPEIMPTDEAQLLQA